MSDKSINKLIILVSIAIMVVISAKYILPMVLKGNDVSLNFSELTLTNLENQPIPFRNIGTNNKQLAVFIFTLNDCQTCIMKGMADALDIQKKGEKIIYIIVHNNFDEFNSWSDTYAQGSEVYYVNTLDSYKFIKSPHLPVMIFVQKGKVDNFKYIFP